MKKVIFLPLFLLVVLSAFVFLYGRLSYLSGEDTKTPSPASFALLPYKEQAEIIKNVSGDSPTKAWVYLKQSYREEGGPSVEDTTWPEYSHTLGHIVGHSFYNRYGIESLSFCDTSLGFACMHGVVEELIVQKGIEGARECSLGFVTRPLKTRRFFARGLQTWSRKAPSRGCNRRSTSNCRNCLRRTGQANCTRC